MPLSTRFLFGGKQDFAHEMAEPIAMVPSRQRFRVWQAPFLGNGTQSGLAQATHHRWAEEKGNNSGTGKIGPAVDGGPRQHGQQPAK
jgi:hypothetical protein